MMLVQPLVWFLLVGAILVIILVIWRGQQMRRR
jgi:hypothetical protein